MCWEKMVYAFVFSRKKNYDNDKSLLLETYKSLEITGKCYRFSGHWVKNKKCFVFTM